MPSKIRPSTITLAGADNAVDAGASPHTSPHGGESVSHGVSSFLDWATMQRARPHPLPRQYDERSHHASTSRRSAARDGARRVCAAGAAAGDEPSRLRGLPGLARRSSRDPGCGAGGWDCGDAHVARWGAVVGRCARSGLRTGGASWLGGERRNRSRRIGRCSAERLAEHPVSAHPGARLSSTSSSTVPRPRRSRRCSTRWPRVMPARHARRWNGSSGSIAIMDSGSTPPG